MLNLIQHSTAPQQDFCISNDLPKYVSYFGGKLLYFLIQPKSFNYVGTLPFLTGHLLVFRCRFYIALLSIFKEVNTMQTL